MPQIVNIALEGLLHHQVAHLKLEEVNRTNSFFSDGIMKAAFVHNVSMSVSIVLLRPLLLSKNPKQSNIVFQFLLAFEIFSALLEHLTFRFGSW